MMTYIISGAIIIFFMLIGIGIAIIDHIFESHRYDYEDDYEEIHIEQHIDSENNTSIGIQNNYYSDK